MADPSPQERADYLVRKLEEFIRAGKTEHGLSFKTWQALARAEIAAAFADIEQRQAVRAADLTLRRILIVGAVSLVTIGFWGAVLAVDRRYGPVASVLLAVAGLVLAAMALEIVLRRAVSRLNRRRRTATFVRIEDFDHQLKALESEIRRRTQRSRSGVEEDS
jgi:hypothetical protein